MNETWEYEFDSQSRMTLARDTTDPLNVNVYTYEYDGASLRVAQVVNSVRTEFVVDTNGGLAEVAADVNYGGNMTVHYVRGDDLLSQQRVRETNAPRYWYSYDGHGSTSALTDSAATRHDFYTCDAWAGAAGVPCLRLLG